MFLLNIKPWTRVVTPNAVLIKFSILIMSELEVILVNLNNQKNYYSSAISNWSKPDNPKNGCLIFEVEIVKPVGNRTVKKPTSVVSWATPPPVANIVAVDHIGETWV